MKNDIAYEHLQYSCLLLAKTLMLWSSGERERTMSDYDFHLSLAQKLIATPFPTEIIPRSEKIFSVLAKLPCEFLRTKDGSQALQNLIRSLDTYFNWYVEFNHKS